MSNWLPLTALLIGAIAHGILLFVISPALSRHGRGRRMYSTFDHTQYLDGLAEYKRLCIDEGNSPIWWRLHVACVVVFLAFCVVFGTWIAFEILWPETGGRVLDE